MSEDSITKLLPAVAALVWPVLLFIVFWAMYRPIKQVIQSAGSRKFKLKVAGNELSMEKVSELQSNIVTDLQAKVAEIENRLHAMMGTAGDVSPDQDKLATQCILWVDDEPENNSLLVSSLTPKESEVDVAKTTDEALNKFKNGTYHAVVSDMGRPEGEKSGIDLTKKIRNLNANIPIYIFTTPWSARYLRKEALDAGVTNITASGTTLLSHLFALS